MCAAALDPREGSAATSGSRVRAFPVRRSNDHLSSRASGVFLTPPPGASASLHPSFQERRPPGDAKVFLMSCLRQIQLVASSFRQLTSACLSNRHIRCSCFWRRTPRASGLLCLAPSTACRERRESLADSRPSFPPSPGSTLSADSSALRAASASLPRPRRRGTNQYVLLARPRRSSDSALSRRRTTARSRRSSTQSKLCCGNYESHGHGGTYKVFHRHSVTENCHASNVRSDFGLRLLIGRRLRYELRSNEDGA